jgi:hypothetical protein
MVYGSKVCVLIGDCFVSVGAEWDRACTHSLWRWPAGQDPRKLGEYTSLDDAMSACDRLARGGPKGDDHD